MLTIYTYHSEDAPAEMSWQANMFIGKVRLPFVTGSSKDEVIAKANEWFEKEQARQGKYADRYLPSEKNSETKPSTANAHSGPGRGAHFVGKTWVMNVKTREKKRVVPSEAETLVASGEWIKAGPRSK